MCVFFKSHITEVRRIEEIFNSISGFYSFIYGLNLGMKIPESELFRKRKSKQNPLNVTKYKVQKFTR